MGARGDARVLAARRDDDFAHDVVRAAHEAMIPLGRRFDRAGQAARGHVDADEGGDDAEDARVYTLVALLAEPGAEFAGGDFEVMTPKWPGGKRRAVAWRKGDLIAFPAQKVWHRVMPTTAGLRRTLVVWAKDPTIATNPP